MNGNDARQIQYDAVIVSPNVAVDSYYLLDRLTPEAVNRATWAMHTAGGKGLNMGRALQLLGGKPLCLGIAGGRTGRFVADEARREQIACELVWCDTPTRQCNTLVVEDQSQPTVVLEPGGAAGPEALDALAELTLRHAAEGRFVSLTGSLPPDAPVDYYASLVMRLKALGIRASIDTASAPLRLAAEAGASIVKVNREEFYSAFSNGGAGDTGQEWPDADVTLSALAGRGLEILVITDGPRGAFVYPVEGAPFKVSTRVERVVSTVGAGDTFIAGLLLQLGAGSPLEEAAIYASAAAAATVQQVGCGFLDAADVVRFLEATSVERRVATGGVL